jgi:hypothetical protein
MILKNMARAIDAQPLYATYTQMMEAEYQMLCRFIEDQYRQVLEKVDRNYRENLLAIESLRGLITNDSSAPASADLFRKQHGDLIVAVREAALRLGSGFALQDIERFLKAEKPLLMLQTSRKSISTALRRLYEARELMLIQEGRGTRPAYYSANIFVKGTDQGKEAYMGTVSGKQA